ncbi:MAG: class I SAM-dependent methyltransferase [Candidatus Pacebacteria bacterium]|nr:class I SAM-dependent methyltransferase [Candidatus Paceibacterota bacterium]MBP9851239.1 class I SAM-dependent methyltransferase [Candidatus Paceibacterota bacterium]
MDTNQLLLARLQNSLSKNSTFVKVKKDFEKTFERLGIDPTETTPFATGILQFIRTAGTIEEAETNIKQLFTTRHFNGKNVFELIQAGLQERFEIIFNQLRPHLKDVGNAIDYGCGSGTLTQMLYDRCGISIEGVDVRDFRAKTVSIPVRLFDGYSVPVSDKHYECAVLTNVIHHEADNEKILLELNRIVSRKLVIIETVPEADDEKTAAEDWGRMLLNDTLWNRFFNYANIPVPGTYEIPSNWIKRFEKYGWKCIHSEDLGFDQPTIQDRHHLLVFER